ncbi:hypothetical protein BDV38DRAFT_146575 [Aspergillus pseudotamarii]|uniref:Uncharacterized protein n=1 Tax=Aspergillus pseudotamarii TaxID=132259 RepID=A0A5N6SN61_ASPPS|nr:uncharacterized protein BDV38DRAFT_146575 [Aspergillus pseudotamarii]KAE8134813.1 hypothetical protein BDV38DRAFT_146575 [Aspergillus pseudotamarii]
MAFTSAYMDRVYQKSVGCLGSWQFLNAHVVFFFSFCFVSYLILFYFFPPLLRLIFASFYIYMGEATVIAYDLLSDSITQTFIGSNNPVSVRWYRRVVCSCLLDSSCLCFALCPV